MTRLFGWSAALVVAVGHAVDGQATVPLRPLGRTVAVSQVPFTNPVNVRQLASGRVLVNDATRRRVLSLDSMLANPIVIIDSVPGLPNSYGTRATAIIPYLGDSTLFVDPASTALVVLDPDGKVIRHLTSPAGALNYLVSPQAFGYVRLDARGRLVYQMPARAAPPVAGLPSLQRDSTYVVAYDFSTRRVDTVGAFRIQVSPISTTNATTPSANTPPPLLLPTMDGWATTSTGRVALVRGQDYHVDWVNADGSRSSSPKVAYDWRRISDAEKVAFADSVTRLRDSVVTQMLGTLPPGGRVMYDAFGNIGGIMLPSTAAGGPPVIGGAGRAGPIPAAVQAARPMTPISPLSIPDYLPPFDRNAVRADEDGRLWVKTTPAKPLSGGIAYDVVDGTGKLVDRVLVPEGKTLLGFGAGGVVYLVSRDAGVAHIERVRFR